MAEKGKKLRLNITVPNNEALKASYDTDDDSWSIKIDLDENSMFKGYGLDALIVTQHVHNEIHEGKHFFIEDAMDLANGEVLDVQFFTADVPFWKNFSFELSPESELEWFLYEGATVITPGTQVIPNNNNRNSGSASSAVVRWILNASVVLANADTAVAGAYELAHSIIGSGKTAGLVVRDDEIILKQNTYYCFRGIANAAGYLAYHMKWYEHQQV